jgi:hypothetical protein
MIADPANLLWADALQQLKCRMARDTFNTWLLGSRVVDSGQDALTIGILHHNGLPWLQRYLRPVIEQTLHLVAGRPIAVDFVAYSPEQEDEYVESASDEGLDDEDGNEEYEKEEDEEEFDDDEGDTEYEQEEDDEEVGRGDPRPTSCSASKAPHRGSTEHAGRAGRRNGRNKPAKELGPNDFYIKVKTAFRRRALRLCKGAPLSVLNCLWCHVNDRSLAWPSIETIMRETGYSRGVVCNAIAKLERLGLIVKRPRRSQSTEYAITAYASFGPKLAPCLFEEQED